MILQPLPSKCIPVFISGLEVSALSSIDLMFLDFAVNHFFVKLLTNLRIGKITNHRIYVSISLMIPSIQLPVTANIRTRWTPQLYPSHRAGFNHLTPPTWVRAVIAATVATQSPPSKHYKASLMCSMAPIASIKDALAHTLIIHTQNRFIRINIDAY